MQHQFERHKVERATSAALFATHRQHKLKAHLVGSLLNEDAQMHTLERESKSQLAVNMRVLMSILH